MTSEQKQAQAARCPCKGTDDYCPCQNVRLDQAWDKINALGGSDVQDNSYDQAIVDTVKKTLDIIEAIGGMDPKLRALALPLERSGGAT